MSPLLIALIVIVVVNAAALMVIRHRGRKDRERDERLTAKAAERALESGIARVRGDEWVRSHRR